MQKKIWWIRMRMAIGMGKRVSLSYSSSLREQNDTPTQAKQVHSQNLTTRLCRWRCRRRCRTRIRTRTITHLHCWWRRHQYSLISTLTLVLANPIHLQLQQRQRHTTRSANLPLYHFRQCLHRLRRGIWLIPKRACRLMERCQSKVRRRLGLRPFIGMGMSMETRLQDLRQRL